MLFSELFIDQLRILDSLEIQPVSGINQLLGPNGSGKTSVLEAIHLLAVGRSFRTRKTPSLLPKASDELILRASFTDPESGIDHKVGMQKTRSGETLLKLDYQRQNSIVEISQILPVKVISPDSHALVQEGPDQRRQFLDWGLFHVKPEFLLVWKDYRRALQQRNQMLKVQAGAAELHAWDEKVATTGEALHALRLAYATTVIEQVRAVAPRLGLIPEVDLKYRRGWLADATLAEALYAEQEQTIKPAFTTVGPHRADLILTANGRGAKEALSRGEQKLLVYALHLSQLQNAISVTNRRPIVLLDDLVAELDVERQQLMQQALMRLQCQVFITGNTGLSALLADSSKTFHMAAGKVTEVV